MLLESGTTIQILVVFYRRLLLPVPYMGKVEEIAFIVFSLALIIAVLIHFPGWHITRRWLISGESILLYQKGDDCVRAESGQMQSLKEICFTVNYVIDFKAKCLMLHFMYPVYTLNFSSNVETHPLIWLRTDGIWNRILYHGTYTEPMSTLT
jgi:hypothetical protein